MLRGKLRGLAEAAVRVHFVGRALAGLLPWEYYAAGGARGLREPKTVARRARNLQRTNAPFSYDLLGAGAGAPIPYS
jgi:hypothetical protein